MKLKLNLVLIAAVVSCFAPAMRAQSQPERLPDAVEKTISEVTQIEIRNLEGEKLGRVRDLGVDLSTGRIIEVFVVSGEILGLGGRTISVPPLALTPDTKNEVYTINASKALFSAAPEIDLTNWMKENQHERIAAAYRYFGQEPYFLESGEKSKMVDGKAKVTLGYVERSSKINGLEIKNLQNELLGKVYSLGMDIPKGRIIQVVVVDAANPDAAMTAPVKDAAASDGESRHVIPAMALSFNSSRDGLLLDNTRAKYSEQPRYVLTGSVFSAKAHSVEESYEGPRTSEALEQGKSDLDVACTTLIKKNINDAKISGRRLQVGTKDGRVTLRGTVRTEADKTKVGVIAIAASKLELVDNQIVVVAKN